MEDPKIIKVYEEKGHVEFDCGDGIVQRAQDLFDTTAEKIQHKVAEYCAVYRVEIKKIEMPVEETSKIRAIEGKSFKIEEAMSAISEL